MPAPHPNAKFIFFVGGEVLSLTDQSSFVLNNFLL